MVLTDAHYFEEIGPKKLEEIRKLLDENENRSKLEAMKRLLALVSLGKDMSSYFPYVVKNVIGTTFEVKKLVYMFLVYYAEEQSDAALLAVNSFQKDLTHGNQLIRAQALRVMTSIRVGMIAQLQVMAIKQVMRDPSPYVRKAAAIAVIKVFHLDADMTDELVEIVKVLLGDSSTLVIGAAIAAYLEICPNRWDVIHGHYRRLCRVCADCDEWSQSHILRLFARYSRLFFADPNREKPDGPKECDTPNDHAGTAQNSLSEGDLLDLTGTGESDTATKGNNEAEKDALDNNQEGNGSGASGVADSNSKNTKKSRMKKSQNALDAFYDNDGDDGIVYAQNAVSTPFGSDTPAQFNTASTVRARTEEDMPQDQVLMFKCIEPLLRSRNAGVALEVILLFHHCAPKAEARNAVKSLVRLCLLGSELSMHALSVVATIVHEYKGTFEPMLRHFFLRASDPAHVARCKLYIVSQLVSKSSLGDVMRELQAYMDHLNDDVVRAAVRAMGQCAAAVPSLAETVIKGLMQLVRAHSNPVVVAESVVMIRSLLADSTAQEETQKLVQKLLCLVPSIQDVEARATLVWIAGEYQNLCPNHAAEVFRRLALNFVNEPLEVKLQIINLAMKMSACQFERLQKLIAYVIQLTECDEHYEVRDRGCCVKAMLPAGASASGDSVATGNLIAEEIEASMQQQPDQSVDGIPANLAGDMELLSKKRPTPSIPRVINLSSQFNVGSLSFCIGKNMQGYIELPRFQDVNSPDSLREPAEGTSGTAEKTSVDIGQGALTSFYDSDAAGSSGDDSDSSSETSSDSSDDDSESAELSSDFSDSEKESDESESDTDQEETQKKKPNQDDLLDLGFFEGASESQSKRIANDGPVEKAAVASVIDLESEFANTTSTETAMDAAVEVNVGNVPLQWRVALHFTHAKGLQVDAAVTKEASMHGSQFKVVRLKFTNTASDYVIPNIKMGESVVQDGQEVRPFVDVGNLMPGGSSIALFNVNFAHKTSQIRFEVISDLGTATASFTPLASELLTPLPMSQSEFERKSKKLTGMLEASRKVDFEQGEDSGNLVTQLLQFCHMMPVNVVGDSIKLAGEARGRDVVLLQASLTDSKITVKSDDGMLANRLAEEIKKQLVAA